MKRLTALLLLAAACAGNPEGEDGPPPERTRLCIENATAAYGAITARAGMVRYHVLPGQTECKPLLNPGPLSLRATTIGGGVAGPMRYATTLQASGYRCWRWRLTDAAASAADVGPCPSEFQDVADDTIPADSSGGAPR